MNLRTWKMKYSPFNAQKCIIRKHFSSMDFFDARFSTKSMPRSAVEACATVLMWRFSASSLQACQSFYRALLRPFLTLEQFRSLDEVLSSSVALVQDASNPQGRGENWLKFGLQVGIWTEKVWVLWTDPCQLVLLWSCTDCCLGARTKDESFRSAEASCWTRDFGLILVRLRVLSG